MNSIAILASSAGSTTTTMTMDDLISTLSKVVTGALGWVGQAVDTITGNPFILITAGFLVLGGAIGILGRLLSRR